MLQEDSTDYGNLFSIDSNGYHMKTEASMMDPSAANSPDISRLNLYAQPSNRSAAKGGIFTRSVPNGRKNPAGTAIPSPRN